MVCSISVGLIDRLQIKLSVTFTYFGLPVHCFQLPYSESPCCIANLLSILLVSPQQTKTLPKLEDKVSSSPTLSLSCKVVTERIINTCMDTTTSSKTITMCCQHQQLDLHCWSIQVTLSIQDPCNSALRQVLKNSPLQHDRLKDELGWQQCIGKETDPTTWKAFRTKMLMQFDLQVFAFASPVSLVVKILHSLMAFFPPDTGHKQKGKQIGFVSDKTLYKTPHLVLLQKEKMWKWIDKLVSKDWDKWKIFYAPLHNQLAF